MVRFRNEICFAIRFHFRWNRLLKQNHYRWSYSNVNRCPQSNSVANSSILNDRRCLNLANLIDCVIHFRIAIGCVIHFWIAIDCSTRYPTDFLSRLLNHFRFR
jgi:hypothetical protein